MEINENWSLEGAFQKLKKTMKINENWSLEGVRATYGNQARHVNKFVTMQ